MWSHVGQVLPMREVDGLPSRCSPSLGEPWLLEIHGVSGFRIRGCMITGTSWMTMQARQPGLEGPGWGSMTVAVVAL